MQLEHRYILEKGSKKHICPNCNKRSFVLYLDKETNEYLPATYGRCDRESKCSYFLNPYLEGYAKAIEEQNKEFNSSYQFKPIERTINPIVYFDFETFKATLNPERYEQNTFIQNLLERIDFPFNEMAVCEVIEAYRLGTVSKGYRAGANTFPFIDINGNVRAIQVKQFDEANHTTGTDFLHSIIEKHHTQSETPLPAWLNDYLNQDKRVTCLFGEHLLNKYPSNPVVLVEAPKTAVYGTLYFGKPKQPKDFIWLAVYNKSSFSFDKLKVLKGRDIFVIPDLSKDGVTFSEWQRKAKEYESLLTNTRFIFSDLLERLATAEQKENGADIADVLIQHNWRDYQNEKETLKELTPETLTINTEIETDKLKPVPIIETFDFNNLKPEITHQANWTDVIEELESYFTTIELPTEPVILNKGTVIINSSLFISNHLSIVKYNNGKKVFLPYLKRLNEFKQILFL